MARGSLLWLVTAAGMLMPAWAAAQEVEWRPTLKVTIDDRSDSGGPQLAAAQLRAATIFDAAGVRLVWIGRDEASRHLDAARLVILGGPGADRVIGGKPALLGVALAEAGRAYVHYGRIVRLANELVAPVPVLLGKAIAHELGHVLLGPGHSASGLMFHALGADPLRLPAFTPEQLERLHARLRAGS